MKVYVVFTKASSGPYSGPDHDLVLDANAVHYGDKLVQIDAKDGSTFCISIRNILYIREIPDTKNPELLKG